MKIKKLELIPGVGLNMFVRDVRRLIDPETQEIVEIEGRDEPIPVGINDFAADPFNPTPEEHEVARQKIREQLQNLTGADFAMVVADIALAQGRQAVAERKQREAEQLQTELATAIDATRSENRELHRQLAVITTSRDKVNEQLQQERQQRQTLELALKAEQKRTTDVIAEVQRASKNSHVLQPEE